MKMTLKALERIGEKLKEINEELTRISENSDYTNTLIVRHICLKIKRDNVDTINNLERMIKSAKRVIEELEDEGDD